MSRATVLGTGHYVPDRVVTNAELEQLMDTSDEWIQQRTGIQERRFVDFENDPMGSAELGTRASRAALEDAGVTPDKVDCIIHATLSPDRQFPGDGVTVQTRLGVPAGVPAFDIRNQCSGFLYGLQMAQAFVEQGLYRRILLVGAETHSSGLDFTNRGRDVAVIFGDGAAAAVLGPASPSGASPDSGVLRVRVHADGRYADALYDDYPSSCANPRVDLERPPDPAIVFPQMQGKRVFKHAVTRMPEVLLGLLEAEGLGIDDLDLLIPHQANLRISEMVQQRLGLPDHKVFNNIQKFGNTTAASIPLALDQARGAGRIEKGHLVGLVAFGAGFTWGGALVRF